MKSQYIGAYEHQDGYSDNTIMAHLCLVGHKLVAVYPFGFIKSAYLPMDITDVSEAEWLINNHPNGKAYKRA